MKFATLNCNGFKSLRKLESVQYYLEKYRLDILFLQETHVDNLKLGKEIEQSLGGKILWSLGQTDSRGVGIFVSNRCQTEIIKFHHDVEGRLVYVDIDREGDQYRLINIYAPNDPRARKQFFKDLIYVVNTRRTILMGGDFNVIENTRLDKIGGNPDSGSIGWPELQNIIQTVGLRDVFRTLYPNRLSTTWRSPNVACRLDRFYLSSNRLHAVKSIQQEISFSDHELVILEIQNLDRNHKRGKGTWIFPDHLTEDEDFKQELLYNLIDIRLEPLEEYLLEWWDDLKNVTKTVAIEWCRDKKRVEDFQYTRLCKEYRRYESEQNLKEMDRVKGTLDALEQERARGAQIRSKAQILDSNEDPSTYFVKKEIYQGKKKLIEEIEVDGVRTNKQPEITQAFTKFYSQLYKSEPVQELTEQYLSGLNKLEEDNIGNEISLEDIKLALSQMENNKSPGPDGLTKEFYVTFFEFLGPILVKLYKTVFSKGKLTNSMKLSYITLICKNEKEPHLCKNYRPISLLNIDYKIITKVLSNRLRTLLPKLIHPDQTCSVKGRSIQDNCHYLRDIIEYINSDNATGALLSLDQEKAFDRIDHKYLIDLLKYYGFSHNFINWVSILYTDISSSVIVNGHISQSFNITRSVRQGCSLSPLLYVLALEPVLNKIRSDPIIKGCPIPGNYQTPPKLTAYADDCKFVLQTDESVDKVIDHFDEYKKFSGANLNKTKTEVMYLGRWKNRTENRRNIKIVKSMTVFGITFGTEPKEEDNWRPVINKIQRKLDFYGLRILSYYGKAKLCNVMILPQVWYLATIFPPNKDTMKIIERLIFAFIWNNKHDKVKRETMYLPVTEGGIGLVNIECKYLSLLLNQMMKVCINIDNPWVHFGHMYLGLKLRAFQIYNFNNCNHPHRLIQNPGFYKEIVKALEKLKQADPDFALNTSNCNSRFFYKKLLETKNIKPKCIERAPLINFKTIFESMNKSLIDPIALNITFQLIHGVVPVAYTIHRWGGNINPNCLLCSECRETIEHLFLDCTMNHLAKHFLIHVCYTALGHRITNDDIRYGVTATNSEYKKQILLLISEYRFAVWLARNRWRYDQKAQGFRDSLYTMKRRLQLRLQADHIRLKQMIFERQWIDSNLAENTEHGIRFKF